VNEFPGAMHLVGIREGICLQSSLSIKDPVDNPVVVLKDIKLLIACLHLYKLLILHSCKTQKLFSCRGYCEIAERIDGLETQVVCLVASGEMHSVAVNDAGRIFTWGDNRFSQLGRQTPSEVTSSAPKSVNSLPLTVFRRSTN